MKPSPDEKQWLQDYLYQTMTYRETYEEIYDHMLNALEHKPAQEFFASTVNDVISDDFGDYGTVHSMEENCRDLLAIKVKERYLFNLYRWVKFPFVIYTAIVFICLNYLYLHSILMAFLLFLFVFLAPAIVITIIGFNLEHTKESIKVPIFRKMVYLFIRLYFFCIVVLFPLFAGIRKIIFHSASAPGSSIYKSFSYSIVVAFLIIHALSLIKTYKFNFNTSLKVNNNAKTNRLDEAPL